ncbi:MAG TPA: universal stress protein [Gemmatimonadales bacterium]|nr:universal stress protein [Gemmatimonadales bacterium]
MRLLVPLDLSSATERVLATATAVARDTGASVWLLHVAEPDPVFVGYDAGSAAVRDQVAHEYRDEHRRLQEHAKVLRDVGIEATPLLVRGPTADTILGEAAKLEVDLIVMATHGHGAMFDILVGSISHAVLRRSTIPVLMVPAR